MPYTIKRIDVFVRETTPDRMSFVLGKKNADGTPAKPAKRRPRGIVLVRMEVADQNGKQVVGMSGDRPAFGWLDKRPKYSPDEKLRRLFDLVNAARETYLEHALVKSAFETAIECGTIVHRTGGESGHEGLSSSYAASLFERALIDAVCRLHNASIFEAVQNGLLGLRPERVLPALKQIRRTDLFPRQPRTLFNIRHTVGGTDPITAADLPATARVNDGEPETLEEYVRRDGLRYFKVKISGNPDADLERLGKIWSVLVDVEQPLISLDANEAFSDIDAFARFIETFERKQLGLFQHTAFIEQPLTRQITHDVSTAETIREISQKKPLVLDEADGEPDSFPRAFDIGYDGVSHKNCKGFFKSLVNRYLCHHFGLTTGRYAFQTGEDLGLMPLLPLHQDFAALGVLDIAHCERNGHHYGYGLSHLTAHEKEQTLTHHADLYTRRKDELFLRVENGQVRTTSLTGPGFGIAFEPDWSDLAPLNDWEFKW